MGRHFISYDIWEDVKRDYLCIRFHHDDFTTLTVPISYGFVAEYNLHVWYVVDRYKEYLDMGWDYTNEPQRFLQYLKTMLIKNGDGGSYTQMIKQLVAQFPELSKSADCPICKAGGTVRTQIIHLNDNHKQTREYIADWVDSLVV